MREPLDLWNLLPAYHRRQDADHGYPLRALLAIVAEQGDVVRHGFDALWDDLFIETCDQWVIPYIGELVANVPLAGEDRRGPDPYRAMFPDLVGSTGAPGLRPLPVVPLRADVAKTIHYRRRKGTPAVLEEIAADVTGWGAKVAELFELLEWTQNDDHVRLGGGGRPFPGFVDVRAVEPMDRVGGAFDVAAHTADVRAIDQDVGWYGIDHLGVFLWRLSSYPLERVPARPVGPAADEWRFHLSPLGQPAPCFINPRPFPPGAPGASPRATELEVPAPIRRARFYQDLVGYRDGAARPRPPQTDLYGPLTDDRSLQVFFGGAAVPPCANPLADPSDFHLYRRVVCRRLDPWPPRPQGDVVAIDPVAGRLALGDGITPSEVTPVEVSYAYGFSADLGGGPYERRGWLAAEGDTTVARTVSVRAATGGTYRDLPTALAGWHTATGRQDLVITLLDDGTYALPGTVEVPAGCTVTIQAESGKRPLLQAAADRLTVHSGAATADAGLRAGLTLCGVVVEGAISVEGPLRRLRVLHSTLVPGLHLDPDTGAPATADPSLVVPGGDESTRFRLEMAFSITGGLRVPTEAEGMWIQDSIVDGVRLGDVTGPAITGSGDPDTPAPPATLARVTVFGRTHVRALPLASEVIFAEPVTSVRRQGGCVRFSAVPAGSVTPRRFRCQPELALEDAEARAQAAGGTLGAGEAARIRRRLTPLFTDRRYGQPAYAQLSLATADEIRKGAEDGSEMGAFEHLAQPRREANLRVRLDEYLPFGLSAGLIYLT